MSHDSFQWIHLSQDGYTSNGWLCVLYNLTELWYWTIQYAVVQDCHSQYIGIKKGSDFLHLLEHLHAVAVDFDKICSLDSILTVTCTVLYSTVQ